MTIITNINKLNEILLLMINMIKIFCCFNNNVLYVFYCKIIQAYIIQLKIRSNKK